MFLVYDAMVLKRNEMLVSSAAQTNAIVTSFVPDHLRDRLMQQQEQQKLAKQNGNLKTFLNDGTKKPGQENGIHASAPLADLFLDTTVRSGLQFNHMLQLQLSFSSQKLLYSSPGSICGHFRIHSMVFRQRTHPSEFLILLFKLM